MLEFIFGILFAQFILPLLDSLGSLLFAWIESLKGNSSIKIAESNKKVEELSKENTSNAVIGFTASGDNL